MVNVYIRYSCRDISGLHRRGDLMKINLTRFRHNNTDCFIPEDHIIHNAYANTPEYLRRYCGAIERKYGKRLAKDNKVYHMELDFCKKCNQMTNHIKEKNECLKCKMSVNAKT